MPPTRRSETRKQNTLTKTPTTNSRSTRSSKVPYTSPLNTKLPATRSRQAANLACLPPTQATKRRSGKLDTSVSKKIKKDEISEPKIAVDDSKNLMSEDNVTVSKETNCKVIDIALESLVVNEEEVEEESVDEETSENSSSPETISETKQIEEEESNDETVETLVSDEPRRDTDSEDSEECEPRNDEPKNTVDKNGVKGVVNELKINEDENVMCVVGESFSLLNSEQPILKDPEIAEVCSKFMGNEETKGVTPTKEKEASKEETASMNHTKVHGQEVDKLKKTKVTADSTTPNYVYYNTRESTPSVYQEQRTETIPRNQSKPVPAPVSVTPILCDKNYIPGENCICWQCGELCVGSVGLQTHLITHTYSLIYCCQQCGEHFPELFALGKHLLTHLESKALECVHCHRKFARPLHLFAHQREHVGSALSHGSYPPHVAPTTSLVSISQHPRHGMVINVPHPSAHPQMQGKGNVAVTYTRARPVNAPSISLQSGHFHPPTPPIRFVSTPVGHPSVGHPSVGHPLVGHPSVGHSLVGHPSVGHPSVGHPSVSDVQSPEESATTNILPAVCSMHAAQAASLGHFDLTASVKIKQESIEDESDVEMEQESAQDSRMLLSEPAIKSLVNKAATEAGATLEESLLQDEEVAAIPLADCIPYGNVQGAYLFKEKHSFSRNVQSIAYIRGTAQSTAYYKQIRVLSEEMAAFLGQNKQQRYPCFKCAEAFTRFDDLTNHIYEHGRDMPFRCYRCTETFVKIGNFKRHLQDHQKASLIIPSNPSPTPSADDVYETTSSPNNMSRAATTASSCTSVNQVTPKVVPGRHAISGVTGSGLAQHSVIKVTQQKQSTPKSNPRSKPSILLSHTTLPSPPSHTISGQGNKPEVIVLDDDEEKGNSDNSSVTVLPHGGTLLLNPEDTLPQIEPLPTTAATQSVVSMSQAQSPHRVVLSTTSQVSAPPTNVVSSTPSVFPCSQCRQGFLTKLDLDRHSLIHALDSPYKCNICGQGFFQGYLLQKHLKYVHGPSALQGSTVEDTNSASVEASQPHLTPVLRVTNPSKDPPTQGFTCEKCAARFTLEDLPPSFLLAHNYEVPKKCPDCQRGSARNQSGSNGYAMNSDEQICCCPTCGKVFNNQRNLTTHMFCHKYSYLYS